MKKKIIFLDGDGTLWYPKKTKRSEKPHWIYEHVDSKDNYLEHLELTPNLKETLEVLKNKGVLLVVISANPRAETLAISEIKDRLNYFGISSYFDSVRSSSGDDKDGKGKVMLEILGSLNLQKEDALMVGDSFVFDFLAACNVGVEALWIENPVSKLPEVLPVNLRKIGEVRDLLSMVE